MKLYLSSYRIPNLERLLSLIGKDAADSKVALLPNAKDYYAQRAWSVRTQEVTNYFRDCGFRPEIVDLRVYNNPATIKRRLQNYDLIWAMGGNTFIMRYEMKRSGFEEAIKELLEEGKVYGGESAGATVAGNTLRGVEFEDNPAFAEEIIWDGLNLIDRFILPHADSLTFSNAVAQARAVHENDKTMIELTDAQAVVVDGSNIVVI